MVQYTTFTNLRVTGDFDADNAFEASTLPVTATGGTTARTLAARFGETLSASDFGVVADGVTDDSDALQAAINYVKGLTYGGKLTLPAGLIRITKEIQLYTVATKSLQIVGAGVTATSIVVDFSGADKIALNCSNPTVISTRGGPITLEDFQIKAGAAASPGPVYIESRFCSDLRLVRLKILHYRNNTAIRASDLFNTVWTDVYIWGAGCQYVRKTVPTACKFTIAAGTTALSASQSIFDATDVGQTFQINNQLYTIASVTDGLNAVTTLTSISTQTAQIGNFEAVRGTMTSGSAALTLNGAVLTSADIGRVVWVLGATAETFPSASTMPLRTTITAVGSSTTATLADACDSSVTDALVVFSPAMDFWSADGVGVNDAINDAIFYGVQVEQFRGVGMCMGSGGGAGNVQFHGLKLHCQNFSANHTSSMCCAVLHSIRGVLSGDFEGQPVNSHGRFLVYQNNGGLSFEDWTGIHMDDGVLVNVMNSTSAGAVTVSNVSISNLVAARSLTTPFVLTGGGSLNPRGTVAAYGRAQQTMTNFLVMRTPLNIPPGTVASAPGIGFTGDSDTGITQLQGANSLSVVTGGTERLGIASDGTVSLGAATGSESLRVVPVASAVNHVRAYGSATGAGTAVGAAGTDTNVTLGLYSKGSSPINLYTSGLFSTALQASITHTASATRFIKLTGSNGGNPSISVSAGALDIASIPIIPSYTVATLPTAATYTRGLIYVSDGTSNKRLAVSDGTNWRWPDGAIVS